MLSVQTSFYISAVLVIMLIVAYLMLKVVQKRHLSDPNYQRKQKEREMERRRREEEDKELDDIAYSMSSSDDDYYSDADYEDGSI